jgi:hypothetical protein
MSKIFVMGAACTATAAAAGAVYYVSPAHQQPLDTPPILVDLAPQQALARVRTITAERYLKQIGVSSGDAQLFRLAMAPTTPDETIATLSFDSESLIVLHAKARALPNGETELDISAELPASRFSNQPALHPYDRKALAAMADLMATDYVSSILKGERLLASRELENAMMIRTGFDENSGRAFADRVRDAFQEAYRQRFETMARTAEEMEREARRRSEWEQDYPYPAQPPPGADRDAGKPTTDISAYDQ